ncbi:HPP family protein [Streptomyces sp. NBC_01304]|uniref:HPP family protein n=1 Tax=Streptomyces sp. NBC_01304 TaxID=2903818 RepID=UPI002E0DBEC9|nr:HPP family protein [Streptomyces sp. NBC_01304]
MTTQSAEPSAAGTPEQAAPPGKFASKAPARAAAGTIAVATAAAVAGLVLLVAAGETLDRTVLIPPLAASAALVFGAPALPLSQPRSVIGGQLLSALTGFVVLAVGGSSMWAAGIAGGLALGVMMTARTPHSPAAATAVIVVLAEPARLPFLLLLLLGTVLLVLVGLLAGRSGRTAPYPAYWW